MLLFSTILTAGGILMIYKSDTLGYPCTIFFGIGMLISIIKVLPGSSYLKLSKTGFEYSSLFRRHSVDWEDILEFRIMKLKQSGLTVNKFVGWIYCKNAHDKGFSKKLSKSITGIEAGLPDTYGLKAEELLKLLEFYKESSVLCKNK